ncbi:MAG: M28 family peptidase [Candidatus Palauibacterales bacterium]|nr:M28 family peptidase [Candidatus Palauibacterales bacterium]
MMKSRRTSIAPLRPPPQSCAHFLRHVGAISLAATLWLAAAGRASAQTIDPEALLAHVRYLASDELAGREAGEPGADRAATYIARLMRAFDLLPLGNEGYLQSFNITTTISISPQSQLLLETPDSARRLELYSEWLPFSFSSPGRVRGEAYRAGYGLSPDSLGDRQGEYLNGKVVFMRGGASDDSNPHAAGSDATPRFKVTSARQQGAPAALIGVARIQTPQSGEPPRPVGIPAGQVIESEEILEWLDADELRITLDAALEPVVARVHNVVGYVPGGDPELRDQVIVIGAHYDHLGLGGPGSLAPDTNEPHNGADDNASGTAVMLELARYFAENEARRPARSLVFVAFTAEEMGLLGSGHFVQRPPVRLERVTAMINFDMVGRLRNQSLQLFGTGTAEEFPALLDSLGATSPLSITQIGDGYGPSDQTSFYARGIPVLHLFTGVHAEYHRPDDDWEFINEAGMAEVARFSIALIDVLGNLPAELTFVEQAPPRVSGGGYGPYLGTIPDFGEVAGGGVRLTGVRPDSPAERAGLQGGDIVIEFGGTRVLNLYDYTYALRAHSPGDTVAITVKRNGRELELSAVLERRQ